MFTPLTKDEIKQIADLLLGDVRENLQRRGLNIEVSESAMNLLADLGYDPQFGARPLKRVIQKEIVNELSKYVLRGEFTEGETIFVDTDRVGLTFSEQGFSGNGEMPEQKAEDKPKDNGAEAKRKKQLDDLMKATKDVKDAVDDIDKEEDDS
jgi:ATP-dependent Clp protease ATP-binding subunit ClpB